MLNWKVRKENVIFVVQIIIAILVPIMAYAGITAQDITSWATLGTLLFDAIRNPYVLGLVVCSVWTAITSPTTPGFFDDAYTLQKKNLNDISGFLPNKK